MRKTPHKGECLSSPINIVRPTEKIYLFKIAHDLGFDKEAIKELLDESK